MIVTENAYTREVTYKTDQKCLKHKEREMDGEGIFASFRPNFTSDDREEKAVHLPFFGSALQLLSRGSSESDAWNVFVPPPSPPSPPARPMKASHMRRSIQALGQMRASHLR